MESRTTARRASIKRAKGNIDLTFLVLVLTLLVCGLVLMFSASYAYAYYYEGNSFQDRKSVV